jgi:toxin FitB
MAEGTARGTPRSALDTIIAAIAEANDCIVVTDNEKDFAGIEIVKDHLCDAITRRATHG